MGCSYIHISTLDYKLFTDLPTSGNENCILWSPKLMCTALADEKKTTTLKHRYKHSGFNNMIKDIGSHCYDWEKTNYLKVEVT